MKANYSFESYFTPEEKIKIKRRKLNDKDFKPIRIFLDTTYILSQSEENSALKDKISMIIPAMERCVKIFEKLLKVIPYSRKLTIKIEQAESYGIKKISPEVSSGISSDLIIFARIADENELSDSTLANAGARKLEYETNRPIAGVVNINPKINFFIKNSINYLESILLHEFTHILGFTYSLFDFFPGGLEKTVFVKKDSRIGLNRTYIKTKNVLEVGRKYFNCNRIDGIELENQGGSSTASSHWEARILLGDYMNGNIFTIEQVISEFTLALLEDSSWYKVNYYTGGLMRYGKHQGCDFIEKDCLNKDLETQFNNDFFNIFDSEEPRCSSGRQSRGYNLLYNIISVENEEYLRFNKNFGSKMADYCPICQEYHIESQNAYYTGNCKKGNYNYGTRINFDYQYGYSNEEIPKALGEKFTNNSFCCLTSVIPKTGDNNNYKKYKNTHPACYPMFCSEKSLTIQINEQYIVCPRQGGKISISKNYEGYIYCPDYNLICTGTELCNDMFDCVEKESLIKNNTYDYDYIIDNSQDIDQIEESNILIGYELSNNGTCPKNCIQCLGNKKCFQCLNGFKLIGKKENDNEPIICSNSIDTTNGYYLINNVYYECFKDCMSCISGNKCNKCVKNKRLNYEKTECINLIDNCENYDKNENCIKCVSKYAFIGNDNKKCINIDEIDINKYYTEDNGISYFPCDTYINNCDECSKKDECNKCISSYVILDNNKSICINKEELDEKKTAFKIDEYNYKSCNLAINNCITCTSENYCLTCNGGYGILNDIHTECESLLGKENKFYYEESNCVYYYCNKSIDDCEECLDKNTCISCKDEFDLDPYNKCVDSSLLFDYFLDENNQTQKCSTFLKNCKFCSSENFCNYCNYDYSFLNNKRNECIFESEFNESNNYYTLDNGINYYNCDFDSYIKGIEDCSECLIENDKLMCIKCKEQFGLLDNDVFKCINIINELDDKIKNNKVYTLDKGINYFTCEKQIENCTRCINNKTCLQCLEDNAFLNDNFSKCYSKDNFEIGYYSNENETIYYPCLEDCGICNNSDYCIKCVSNYAFIGYDRTKCINTNNKTTFNKNHYYTENDGISYFYCDTFIENCDECSKKDECNKCISSYVILDNNKSICINKEELDEKKTAFKIDEYNYKSCNLAINNCITCTSENYCLTCDEGYGIINDIHSKCELLIGRENHFFFEESNGVYYSCNKSLKYCKECSDKETCILCEDNYYLPYNETKCIDINKDKLFYFYDNNLNIYKKCNYGVNNCLKCNSEDYCFQCEDLYTILNDNTEKCELKSLYENNNEYVTLNYGINYYICENLIENCSKCKLKYLTNIVNCYNCKNDFALLDNNMLKCYNIEQELDNLIKNNEIFTNDNNINYFWCNKTIKNCNKCKDEKNCLICDSNYALYEEDNLTCYSKDNFKIGFFNENETRYFSCLSNCDKCNNKTICEKCSTNYMPNENNTECIEKIVDVNELKEKCLIKAVNISNEDLESIINDNISLDTYIYVYQQENKNNNYALNYYINEYYNFSMFLFKYSECSLFLIEKGLKKISTDNIIVNLGNYLDSNIVYIQSFIQYNNKVAYSIYNSNTLEKIDIKKICLNCKEYKIINNYTNSISNYIGDNILSLIQKENINLFNEDEAIFKDICQNLTINNIDCPLEQRKSKFYLGNSNNTNNLILCGDINCKLIKDYKENSTSICSCPIEDSNDLTNIFDENNNNSYEILNIIENAQNDSNYNYNSVYILKCIPKSFKKENIKKNIGFILSIIIIGIQIVCFICILVFPFKNLIPSKINSPPKRENEESKGKINNYVCTTNQEKISSNNNQLNNKDIEKNIKNIDIDILDKTDGRMGDKPSNKNGKKIDDLYLDYINFKEAKKIDKRSFCYYYCHLLFFNQLLLNLISCCSCNFSKSFLPFPLKLIKLLFLYMINLFINAILTSDNYLIEKYNYFNNKYDIENNIININNNEKISYSIKNGKIQIIGSFFICLFLHYILLCFINIRKKIGQLLIKEGKNKEIKEKNEFKNNKKQIEKIKSDMSCKFNYFFVICLLIMIVIFFYLTNICVAYNGTVIDIFSQSLISFILLQINPFVICFIVSLFRYLGLAGNCPFFFLINKCLSGL